MNQQQKLALLLQPALIRLIDQLRQQLTQSVWQWQYETQEIWPASVPQDIREQYKKLLIQLETATETQADEIQSILETMPTPIPLYLLELTKANTTHCINMWELCYQICFQNYIPQIQTKSVEVPKIDSYLIDSLLLDENGNIAWPSLDQKAALVVERVLHDLD